MDSQSRMRATVLKLRRRFRDARRAEVAEVVQARDLIRERRLRNQDDREAALARRVRSAQGVVDVDRLILESQFDAELLAQQAMLAQQDAMLAAEEEKRRTAVAAADVDVKIMEKLEQRVLEREQSQRRQRAERELSDLLNSRRDRRQART